MLVRRHFDALYRFFRSRLDTGVADLAQKTFMACVESRDRLPEGVRFIAYLFGIARKQLLMHLRTKGRHNKVVNVSHVSAKFSGATPSGAVAMREEQRLLLTALRRLPIDVQLILLLFYWEDMPLAEIATVMEIPIGTVKSRIHRSRTMLRALIEEFSESPELAQTTLGGLDKWARSLRALLSQS